MPGSGLGLAIVKQAAEAHGGSVVAANADGGGAQVEVSFGPVVDLGEAARRRWDRSRRRAEDGCFKSLRASSPACEKWSRD